MFAQWWLKKVEEIRTSNDSERIKSTIFGGVLNSSLPDAEKTNHRLASETQLVVFAGEGTTGKTINSLPVSHPLQRRGTLADPQISSAHP